MRTQEFPNLVVFSGGVPSDESYLKNGFYANSSVISINKNKVIIDTPMLPSIAEPIVKYCNGSNIDSIINTHGHLDHHLTNCLFKAGKIIQSKTTNSYLKGFENYVDYYDGLKEYEPVIDEMKQLELKHADVVFEDKLLYEVDGCVLVLENIGEGESRDSTIVYIPSLKYLFLGDLVYCRVHPFIGGVGRISNWVSALERMKQYDCSLYIPGHGDVFSSITEIEEMINYLEDFSSDFIRLVDEGMTKEVIKKTMRAGNKYNYAMKSSFFRFSVDCCIDGYPKSTSN